MAKKKIIQNAVTLICVIITWELLSRVINKSLFLPSPEKTFQCIEEMIRTGVLFKHLWASFRRVTSGVCIAAAIAVPVGFLISWNKIAGSMLRPIVNSLHSVPVTCFMPMMILALGVGEKMKITLLAVAVFFAYLPSVVETASEKNTKMIETAYTMGFSYPRMLLHCQIPYIAPELIKSFIAQYGVGWTYVIIAEMNNSRYGLGHLMYVSAARGRSEMVYASIVVVIAVSIIFDSVCTHLVERIFWWKYGRPAVHVKTKSPSPVRKILKDLTKSDKNEEKPENPGEEVSHGQEI